MPCLCPRALLCCLLLLLPASASAQAGAATYELCFDSTWSAQTHPQAFPPNPHFSPLVGATHDVATRFWQVGQLASPGIERMAEEGATAVLRGEVSNAIAAGGASQVLQFGGLSTSPAFRTVQFSVTAEHARLTLVSMLAPSPDWFVGVDGLDLRPGGKWVELLFVPLQVWDAGTDSGTSYLSANANTQPPRPIAAVHTAAGPFQGLPGPVGCYRIRLLSASSVFGCGVNPAGSLTTSALPRLGRNATVSIDDPPGTFAVPASTLIAVSATAQPASPCGILITGHGLAAPGAPGEFLLGLPLVAAPGPVLTGAAAPFTLAIPAIPQLVRQRFYVQGAVFSATRAGLTDAVELFVGA